MTWLIVALVWMLSLSQAAAQGEGPTPAPARHLSDVQPAPPTPAAAPARRTRRWTLSAVTGRPSLRPLTEFEQAMREAGFDWSGSTCVFGLCFGDSTYPFSMHSRIYRDTWSGSVHRLIGRRVGVGLTTGSSLIGWTSGRHRASFVWLEVETKVAHLAPIVTFTPWAGIRVGAGPGLFTTRFTERSVGTEVGTTTERRPGGLAELSLTFPRRTRLFVDLTGQTRWIAGATFGPVSRYDPATDVTATFPRTPLPVSHWRIGLGAGLRF